MLFDKPLVNDYRNLVLTLDELKDPELAYLSEDLERRDTLLQIMVHYDMSLTQIMNSSETHYGETQFCIKQLIKNIKKLQTLREVEQMDCQFEKGEL
ncbi:hypothetical protein [Staphylococcus epidermidis]|uniref:hypothetical protein n=1 Tax=Staphylococcus epidermidis TaxID=1282 RepID=UPI00119F1EF3|nr:hypothetical protein [Staphylococcus epidermidis]MDS3952351.1 hypothetical protein [Staphylococcus epidermidis]